MQEGELIIALREDIGNPTLFTGRKEEMAQLLDWVALVKREGGRSQALLARKRRGKTALLQRFYNILYTRGDPKVIPFFFRVPEYTIDLKTFSISFYTTLMTQYLSFKQRLPHLIDPDIPLTQLASLVEDDRVLSENVAYMRELFEENASAAWNAVRETPAKIAARKEERIIQFIDEFQFMNEYVLRDDKVIKLCSAYQKTAESKVAPQIVTGSYIGKLHAIVTCMVGRHTLFTLGPLPHDEAMELVYTYAEFYNRRVNPDQAAYIAEVCTFDPYYIACIFQSQYKVEGNLSERIARDILTRETRPELGTIYGMWADYIAKAFDRVNQYNAKKIVLFLAKHAEREFTRDELKTLLKLDLEDHVLEERLERLIKADILARGSSNFRLKGLGDPLFELVFRRLYEEEIEGVDAKTLLAEYEQRFLSMKGEMANLKGLASEHKLRYYLSQAGKDQISLAKLSLSAIKEELPTLGPFRKIDKLSKHPELNKRLELDLYARAENPTDPDLGVEVKDTQAPVGAAKVAHFIGVTHQIRPLLDRPTHFLFYSEKGFTRGQVEILSENGILACDGALLAKCFKDGAP